MELLTRWNDQVNKILQEVSGSGDSIAEQDGMTEKIKALGAKMEKGAKQIHRARHS
jgi:hypothetical protein